MKYIDYMRLNPFQRFWYKFSNGLKAFPKKFVGFFVALGKLIVNFFVGIGKAVAGYFVRFVKGNWAVKVSYVIMGFGNAVQGQVVKGLLFLLMEAAYIAFMVFFGWGYIVKFPTLGTQKQTFQLNPDTGGYELGGGDNSLLILLYGVLIIVVTLVFLITYFTSIKSAYKAQQVRACGEKPASFMSEVKDMFDRKFHITLLAFPTLTIAAFTILPLIFMVLIAFTNYNLENMPPANLFTWTGFDTFADILAISDGASKGATFLELTKWTIIWAIFATVLNYLLGMILALMINKKGIKLKALWRTLFVITVAVPQFVTLLLMNEMLQQFGAINILLTDLGIIEEGILFLNSTPLIARITVIIVNCWVGIPYTILITSGILMNIPADLYESATIDGAGPVRSFFSITLPYMLFVTTPYLITNFISNINNFNVIFLLTGGGPKSPDLYQAGYTDLLVTWLYNLTTVSQDYNLASAVGILVFIVCATLSLVTFNLTKSAKNEEEFS